MKRSYFITLLVFSFLLMGSKVFSQNNVTPSPNNQRHEKIQALITMRLTTALNLNEQKSQQLSAILKKYHEKKRDLRKQVQTLTQQLRVASTSGNVVEIQNTIKQLDQTKFDLDRVDDQMFEEAKKMLTPQQQAQFLLVMDDIHKEIRALKGDGNPIPNNGVWVK